MEFQINNQYINNLLLEYNEDKKKGRFDQKYYPLLFLYLIPSFEHTCAIECIGMPEKDAISNIIGRFAHKYIFDAEAYEVNKNMILYMILNKEAYLLNRYTDIGYDKFSNDTYDFKLAYHAVIYEYVLNNRPIIEYIYWAGELNSTERDIESMVYFFRKDRLIHSPAITKMIFMASEANPKPLLDMIRLRTKVYKFKRIFRNKPWAKKIIDQL
jgi:hypothetical protein